MSPGFLRYELFFELFCISDNPKLAIQAPHPLQPTQDHGIGEPYPTDLPLISKQPHSDRMVKEGVAHGYILDSRSFMGLQLQFGLEHFEVQAYKQKRPQNLHIHN